MGSSTATGTSTAPAVASAVSASVSVSTAADIMRMLRAATAARGWTVRARDTAALYLCAGTTKLVGRTLCRKAVLLPAKPINTAKGKFIATVLIFAGLVSSPSRERERDVGREEALRMTGGVRRRGRRGWCSGAEIRCCVLCVSTT